jgi:hypothetical protein
VNERGIGDQRSTGTINDMGSGFAAANDFAAFSRWSKNRLVKVRVVVAG